MSTSCKICFSALKLHLKLFLKFKAAFQQNIAQVPDTHLSWYYCKIKSVFSSYIFLAKYVFINIQDTSRTFQYEINYVFAACKQIKIETYKVQKLSQLNWNWNWSWYWNWNWNKNKLSIWRNDNEWNFGIRRRCSGIRSLELGAGSKMWALSCDDVNDGKHLT